MIGIAFFCVLGSRVTSLKAASAGAILMDRVFAFFSSDKAGRRGVGLSARAGLKEGANCRQ
ncbi:MAG TPA: hypothetical protein DEQ41_17420 [Shewanella sp.]|nr:hypothetical protein [Shewanella sp.]